MTRRGPLTYTKGENVRFTVAEYNRLADALAAERELSDALAGALRLAWDVDGATTAQASKAYRAALSRYDAALKGVK